MREKTHSKTSGGEISADTKKRFYRLPAGRTGPLQAIGNQNRGEAAGRMGFDQGRGANSGIHFLNVLKLMLLQGLYRQLTRGD